MKNLELKNKTDKELIAMLDELRSKLAKLNFEKGANTLKDTSQIKKIKKGVARILTLMESQNSQTPNPKQTL